MAKSSDIPCPLFANEVPEVYAVWVAGDCMAPLIPRGCAVICDQLSPLRGGDFVVVYKRRDLLKPGEMPGVVKRLVTDPPSKLTFPYTHNPYSEFEPCISLQTLNPERSFFMAASAIEAIHRCLGPAEIDSEGSAILPEGLIERARKGAAIGSLERNSPEYPIDILSFVNKRTGRYKPVDWWAPAQAFESDEDDTEWRLGEDYAIELLETEVKCGGPQGSSTLGSILLSMIEKGPGRDRVVLGFAYTLARAAYRGAPTLAHLTAMRNSIADGRERYREWQLKQSTIWRRRARDAALRGWETRRRRAGGASK
jgi:hypothetical protein